MRRLTDAEIDYALDPYKLADRIPGFKEKMDGVKDIRVYNDAEVSKFTKKEYDGWKHVGSLPSVVVTALYQAYTPEELAADGGALIFKFLNRWREYRVTEDKL